MMTPENVLLIGLALLALLFFVGGLIDLFNELRVDFRQRRRRREQEALAAVETDTQTEWVTTDLIFNPVVETDSQPEPEVPALTASPAAPPMAAEFAWPARRPALKPPALHQAPSDLPATDTSGDAHESVHVEEVPHDEGERTKIVVHYRNDRIIKGYSYDFYPNKSHFHLLPPVAGFSFTDEAIEVTVEDLKAVFFVKDFAGDPTYNERKHFAPGERPPGRKVAVKFRDGEMLVGSTMGYEPQRPGFFLIPADPKSNNLRVFVVAKAVSGIRFL